MIPSRRTLLAALGLSIPSGLVARSRRPDRSDDPPLSLRFRSFEDAVRESFAGRIEPGFCPRIEVGHSDLIRAGVQGTHNNRPFAGFPARHLRIVRSAFEPGPEIRGVRFYVSTVDVVWTGGQPDPEPSRPLDFSTLPPAPIFT